MSLDLLAAALTASGGVVAGLLAPFIISRLREPDLHPDDPPRPTFREIAASTHLAARLAVVGAAVGAIVGWQLGWSPVLAAWVYLTGVCLVLGYVDARTRLLPTQLIAPSYAVIGGLLSVAALVDWSLDGVWHALLGWLVMGGCYFVLWRFGPRGLGYGDVRLAGLLALCLGYLGWAELLTALYAGFLVGGSTMALLMLARRVKLRTHVPFGPFMMLGALVGLVWGEPLTSWYTSR